MFALANTKFNLFTRYKAIGLNLAEGKTPKGLTRAAITLLGLTALTGAAFADSGTISVSPSTVALTGAPGTYGTFTPYSITCDADSSNNNGKGTVTIGAKYSTTGPETAVDLSLSAGTGFSVALSGAPDVAIGTLSSTALFTLVPVHSDTTASAIGSATVTVIAPLTATPGNYTGTITFTMSETGATSNMTTVTTTATYTYTIAAPTLTGFTLTSPTISGGQVGTSSTTGTLTLSSEAPIGGTAVTITSQWPAYVSVNGSNTSPATVTVPVGQTSTTFTLATPKLWSGTFTDSISAQIGAGTPISQSLEVVSYALQSINVSPSSIQAGGSVTGSITLASNAPAGGWTVNLSMNNSTFVSVPASVVVPAGSSTAPFTVSTSTKSPNSNWLILGSDGFIQKSATFATTSDSIQSINLSQSVIGSGGSSIATVTLNSAAPAGGWTVGITVGAPTYLNGVPAGLTIPEGDTTGTFTITGNAVGATVGPIAINVTDLVSTAKTSITLAGDLIQSVALVSNSVVGGHSVNGTVTLSSAAPAGGWLVNLSSGAPGIASTSVGSVTVLAGATTATFTVNTGVVDVTVGPIAISASDGNSSQSQGLTVTP